MSFPRRLLKFGLYAFVISFGVVTGLGAAWVFFLWLIFRGDVGD